MAQKQAVKEILTKYSSDTTALYVNVNDKTENNNNDAPEQKKLFTIDEIKETVYPNTDSDTNCSTDAYVQSVPLSDGLEGPLSKFFVPFDHAPLVAFNCSTFRAQKFRNPDIAGLVRSTCQLMTQNSRYIDINYDYMQEYAHTLLEDTETIDEYQMNRDIWEINMEQMDFSERDIINMSCYFVLLQFGSGFRAILNKYSKNNAAVQIGIGVLNMYKTYNKLESKSLDKIRIEEIAELFEINYVESPQLKVLCEIIRGVVQDTVDTLTLKTCSDFADYIYYHMDLAWIKSQTKNLSELETVEWIVNDDSKLGITLAPTKSDVVRRCVVIDYKPTNDDAQNAQNNTCLQRLVELKAFLYAINDVVVYNWPFQDIIARINTLCTGDTVDEWNIHYKVGDNRVIALQFGVHLGDEPNVANALMFNLINDFGCFKDQYLYKSLLGKNKNLRVYLFQRVQLIVMELYYNLYLNKKFIVNKKQQEANPLFNFKDISKLTAVVDNVIPFVLLHDNVIKIKDEYKEEWDHWMKEECIIKRCDLETELKAAALWAIEILINERQQLNVAKLTYHLWGKGKQNEYAIFDKHFTRDTIYF